MVQSKSALKVKTVIIILLMQFNIFKVIFLHSAKKYVVSTLSQNNLNDKITVFMYYSLHTKHPI